MRTAELMADLASLKACDRQMARDLVGATERDEGDGDGDEAYKRVKECLAASEQTQAAHAAQAAAARPKSSEENQS